MWSRLMAMSFCGLATTLLPVDTQLSWHKRKGMLRYVWDVGYVVIYDGNGTMQSPIWSVIMQMINKIGQAQSGDSIC